MLENATLAAFIPTVDRDKARLFYEGTLGLKVVGDSGFALVLDANGTTVRITTVPDFAPHPFTVLGWIVDDITASVRELARRGVTFESFPDMGIEQDADAIWHAPGGDKVAWFKDPDGNLLSLSAHE